MDESSQVDLVKSSIALSCANNAVIVGDSKQLEKIVSEYIKGEANKLEEKYNLKKEYNYENYNLLSSLKALYKEKLKTKLLCKHYRCNPQIIRFCNEKFYNNELVIMKDIKDKTHALHLYITPPGNHMRIGECIDEEGKKISGKYNQRQISIVKEEILNKRCKDYDDYSNVGIIAPYRYHTYIQSQNLKNLKNIESDTVYKFQGREKDIIIFATVSDNKTTFIDSPSNVNVAVSRAIDKLYVVASDKLSKSLGSNIGDLIDYIRYNAYKEDVIKSKIVSVFDKLYYPYREEIVKLRKKIKVDIKYDSELLMYNLLKEILGDEKYSDLDFIMHTQIKSIIKNIDNDSELTDSEKRYLNDWRTHADFEIFKKIGKIPIMVIEVDGHDFHKYGTNQYENDRIKDKILIKNNIKVLRLESNGDSEKAIIINKLDEIYNER